MDKIKIPEGWERVQTGEMMQLNDMQYSNILQEFIVLGKYYKFREVRSYDFVIRKVQ